MRFLSERLELAAGFTGGPRTSTHANTVAGEREVGAARMIRVRNVGPWRNTTGAFRLRAIRRFFGEVKRRVELDFGPGSEIFTPHLSRNRSRTRVGLPRFGFRRSPSEDLFAANAASEDSHIVARKKGY